MVDRKDGTYHLLWSPLNNFKEHHSTFNININILNVNILSTYYFILYTIPMSGHSKWSQIKRQKGATDAKKSQIFGKLSRLISTNVKLAHGDRNAPSVRAVIEKAQMANMPKDTIERAILKATETKDMEYITYEAYGPGGVGIMVETLTDNRNRTAQEIKHIFSNHTFALAGIGSVTWAFVKEDGELKATTTIALSDKDTTILETLVEELEANEDVQHVYTNAE